MYGSPLYRRSERRASADARWQASCATLAGSAPGAPFTISQPARLAQIEGDPAAAARMSSQAASEARCCRLREMPAGWRSSRLAGPVDSRNQVDTRWLGGDEKRPWPTVLQQPSQLGLDKLDEVLVGCLLSVTFAHTVNDPGCCGHSDVRLNQPAFQVVEKRLINLAAEPRPNVEELGGFGQALLEPFQ